jgi:hypothetical protein
MVACNRVEAVVQRQQRMPAERYDNRFIFDRQDCGSRLFRSGRQVGHRSAATQSLSNGNGGHWLQP